MERVGHAPKVSVVMPTYNEVERLATAVASVLTQSFSELELLIVDDASSDAIDVVLSAINGDQRCRLIRRAENKGSATARNTGISAAASDKFIAFLDSDDVWYPQKLERQLAWMKSQRQPVACTGYRIVTPFHPNGEVRLSNRVTLHDLLSGCGVSPGSTMVVERALLEKVGPFDEALRRLEDWEWLLRCAKVTPIAVVPEVLALVNNGPREKHGIESVRDSAETIENYALAGRYGLNKREIKLLPFGASLFQMGEIEALELAWYRKIGFDKGRASEFSGFDSELVGLGALALLGTALRLRLYAIDRSFWLDEALLGANVVSRSASTLLTEPLEYFQIAPLGFLLAARSIVSAIGPYDWALRLLPLSAGVLTIFLAVVLARRELLSSVARLTFVGLVALSPTLIYYSTEFKPYISDALATMAILVAVSYRHSRHGTLLLSLAGFFALIFSIPSVFIAAPASLLLLRDAVKTGQFKALVLVGLTWAASAALHALYFLVAGVERGFMVTWWSEHGGFPPIPVDNGEDILWYAKSLFGLVQLAARTKGIATPQLHDHWAEPTVLVLGTALAACLALALAWRPWISFIAIGATLLSLIAAALRFYPFSSRLLLFLVPLVMLIVAVAVDYLCRLIGRTAAAMAAMLFASVTALNAARATLEPIVISDVRGALKVMQRDFRSGDALAVVPWGDVVQRFYALSSGWTPETLRVHPEHGATSLISEVEEKGYHRLWVLAAIPIQPEATNFISDLELRTPVEFSWEGKGTRLVLFNFNPDFDGDANRSD